MSQSSAAGAAIGSSATNHYAALDGLRGFAAVSVVLFHLGHWLHAPGLAANSGLAVDFFFCLSGFVLATAYQRRFDAGLTASAFLRIRLVRLMPLIVLGALVSFAFVLARPMIKHQPVPLDEAALALVLGLLNLPNFTAPSSIGGPQVFPLNGPQYSLFLELLVNLIWSLTIRMRQLQLALAIAAVSFLGMMWLGSGGDQAANFWLGVPRVGLSFFLGVAAFHLDRSGASRFREGLFWSCLIVMAALFYFPRRLPLGLDMVWVAGISPLLVLTGAGVRLPARLDRAALLAGELSYPIYALHYPIFCWVNGLSQSLLHRQSIVVESVVVMFAVLVGSYGALELFDRPTRAALARRVARAKTVQRPAA